MRRRSVIAGVGAAGAAIAAGLYRFTGVFVKHYPPTPYDDLLVQLEDRQQAAKLGANLPQTPDARSLAVELRAGLKPDGLRAAAEADIAAGRLMEADGWVVPRVIALLSALAAKV